MSFGSELEVIFVLMVKIHLLHLLIFIQVILRFFKESEYDLFSELENQLCNYMTLGNVFVFGDFNGRTKDIPDFIQHDELHEGVLDNLPTYSEDILLPTRTSLDQGINDNGR